MVETDSRTVNVASRTHTGVTPKHIAYFLRNSGNLHYFAALKPYLDYFIAQGVHENFLVVQEPKGDNDSMREYARYTRFFTDNCDLNTYDLVLTPTFLRAHERSERTRAVQIFHGMSDKPFTYERDFSNYLLCLCTGQRQVDRLLQYEHNHRMRWAIIGYPKFDHLLTAQRFFNNEKKTVIYCPTWRKEHLSSIDVFLRAPDVIARLVEAYNLIVKPHPNTFNSAREFYDREIVEQLEHIPGITLVRSGNVMPWFAQSDLYVGDISASGYEWLYFDRPMVFLNPQPGVLHPSADVTSPTYLWRCGTVCDDMDSLQATIDKSLHSNPYHDVRETVLAYSVYQPRDNSATTRGIQHIEHLLERNQE
jgi:CDP-glycerol glycerophosphotransferase (TagB/SpsB family)